MLRRRTYPQGGVSFSRSLAAIQNKGPEHGVVQIIDMGFVAKKLAEQPKYKLEGHTVGLPPGKVITDYVGCRIQHHSAVEGRAVFEWCRRKVFRPVEDV